MRIQTVKDLRDYLKKQEISPEELSKRIPISNMTIRRLLRKKDSVFLPEKYRDNFDLYLRERSPRESDAIDILKSLHPDFDELLQDLKKDGERAKSEGDVIRKTKSKLKQGVPGRSLKSLALELITGLRSKKTSATQKAILLGALIYFVNPMDLIPDHIPVVGYLDDFAVMSLALASLKRTDQNLT